MAPSLANPGSNSSPVRIRVLAGLRYRPGTDPSALSDAPPRARLASNELAFGPLPGVREALAATDAISRYPDDSATWLRARLAEEHGVEHAAVTVGNGSVTLIQQVVLATCGPRDEILVGAPSFQAYTTLAATTGARVVSVPLDGVGLDLPGMANAVGESTRAVFVCTPNNPTGGIVTADALEAFLERIPDDVLVVVDEAYREFVDDPAAADGEAALARHDNVLVLRTFSKAYGLAGMRIGYAVGHPAVVAAVQAFRVPFAVSAPAQTAALVSLDRREELARRVELVRSERSRVARRLRSGGCDVPASQGNFLWLPTGQRTAELTAALARMGVLVRGIAEAGIRVTMGTPTENDAFLDAFSRVLTQSSGRT